MIDELLDTLRSLTSLIAEENDILRTGGVTCDISALVGAKGRLIGQLEAACATRAREAEGWLAELGEKQRMTLMEAVAQLCEAAALNARVIRRQIDLSSELLGEISAEAQRLGGARQQTYRRSGTLDRRDSPAPVAVNTRL